MTRVLGVLAGRDMPMDLLCKWAESADVLLAADAGADLLLEAGLKPQKVIGDLDSTGKSDQLAQMAIREGLQLVHDPDQGTTDCDKLLELAVRDGHEEITLAGVEGDQLDHMLATLHSAARSPLKVRVALRSGVGWVLRDEESVTLPTAAGRRISLLPLTPTEGVTMRGVQWPLEKSALDPLGKTSISNRVEGNEVFVRLWEGAAFLFLEVPPEEVPFW